MTGIRTCGGSSSTSPATATSTGTVRIKGEAWVDNWFAMYVYDTHVAEDKVPITTERSFNSETFTFEVKYPFVVNLVIKDYKATDSGLEYIGQPNQQMGDGGFYRSDPEPANWKSAGFDTGTWETATVYTVAQIGVKDGHNDIAWNPAAKLVWTSSLTQDNTLLCKFTVTGS